MKMPLILISLILVLVSCIQKPSQPQVIEGDRSAAVLIASWNQQPNWNPDLMSVESQEWWVNSLEEAKSDALRRCQAWGYSDIDPYPSHYAECLQLTFDFWGNYVCAIQRMEQKIQCVD